MTPLQSTVEKVSAAASKNDPSVLDAAVDYLILELPRQPGTIEADLARSVLAELRKHRRFSHILRLAQAIISDGSTDPQIYRQYAQALIETGSPTAAIGILDRIIAMANIEKNERDDAYGVRGRAWKDIAYGARGVRDSLAKEAISESYESYANVHRANPDALYQGINRVALAAWDRGLALSDGERKEAADSAVDIYNRVLKIPDDKRSAWDCAIAGEALVAQGDLVAAAKWFQVYVNNEYVNAFELAGTARQLNEMWKLAETSAGRAILGPLSARLLELPGGRFVMSHQTLREMEDVSEQSFEKILGTTGVQTWTWMRKGFEAAKSVGRIETEGKGIGTGFLVRGGDLYEGLGDELFLLTNAHVISDPCQDKAILPSEALVRFELSEDKSLKEDGAEIDSIVWQSSIDEHDATLVKFKHPLPDNMKPLPVDQNLPNLGVDIKSRVYIIGHPGGREISFSFEDNELLDYEKSNIEDPTDPQHRKLHYRAPTEPGSSGSPVFNANWKVVGIHHSGSKKMRQLNGGSGYYAANEGISIQSIKRMIDRELGD